MEAIMKQVKHQFRQKEEQEASLIRQLEVVKRKKEQLQQTLQIISSYSAPKEEAASSSTTKQPKEDIQEISSDESQPQIALKTEKQSRRNKQLLVPNITFANIGISNGSKPTKDDLPHDEPTQDHLIFALAGVYLASSRIGNGKDQKSRIRVNYTSESFVIYSLTDNEITPEALKAIETFEQPFEKFSHHLAELPADLKKQLCKHIISAPRHNCSHCKENIEETPFMED
uniref:Uncharacterized protein n=1 Tax=Lactuca sativa TaxID=4236 RepID=A0A9R1WJF5_LACSA|nr:hypothetical protein LSAT_V11C100016620 [Lactuca sativa]